MDWQVSTELSKKILIPPSRSGTRQRLLINLAPADEELRLRLSLFVRENQGVSFCCSDEPLIHSKIDLYLIPLRCLYWLSSIPRLSGRPVFIHGPAYGLAGSFIAGCSDYLKDPWDERELLARAKRFTEALSVSYPWGSLLLRNNECLGPGGSTVLSPTEETILRTLIRNRQKRVEKELLSHLVWGFHREKSRAVDMHIAKLRRKMKSALPAEVRTVILTCRPGGYMLR
ncbi:winged helix-turn-helix domain-containing protein [Marispirochaeta sp.]|jgi:hypothetical protein|uniref:response regulator transcription factor n=1 Tax=Marispirochaeta sp. TaxID=2038653 RepID=UPI0029C61130|nr:winged helix-turn-helix domain-containing protein [Marispirochaeta sp.]